MYDLLIKNARIIDGTGAPWYRADLAVQDGKIAEIGRLTSCIAKTVVDAEDLYLSPGFIDIHSHSDTSLPRFPQAESRILQGVTTEIGGDCGLSAAPVSADPVKRKLLKDYVGDLPYIWNSMGEFLSYVESCRPSVNFGMSAGHGTIRLCIMGFEARKATAEELNRMKALLRQCLEDGSFCLSSGLIYPPGCYADIDELAELAAELVPTEPITKPICAMRAIRLSPPFRKHCRYAVFQGLHCRSIIIKLSGNPDGRFTAKLLLP